MVGAAIITILPSQLNTQPKMKKIYIDLETSGRQPWKHMIHQIAMLIEIDGKVVGEHEFLIRPEKDDVIEVEALEVSGVTVEDLNNNPARLSARHAYQKMVNILGQHIDKYNKQDKAFFLAYNAKFDYDFLRSWWSKHGDKFFGSWFWTPAVDVMALAAQALMHKRHEMPNFKLATVHGLLVGGDQDWHDAMADIKATREIYQGLTHSEG